MQQLQTILPIGSVVQERYSIEALLGKGGFGAVYLVRDQRFQNNLFALKEVIDPNKQDRTRFTFECDVLKRMDHPALPRVYGTFDDDKNIRCYLLMDYVDGPNLDTLRNRHVEKRLSLAQVMRIMAPIVDAVSYLHHQHPPIIHRDIKPANIIVRKDEEGAVLVDFGIAKEYDIDSTTTAIRHCSPGYGAPEQYARGTNPRTDIYGLGATFYALLTGIVPADALYRMTQLGSKHADPLESITALVPAIPAHVSDAIQRAMAINNNDRFASVDEFWQALNAHPLEEAAPPIVGSAPVVPPPVIVPDSHPQPDAALVGANLTTIPAVVNNYPTKRRRRSGVLMLLFVSLALFALLVGALWGAGFFPALVNTGHLPFTSTPDRAQITATQAPSQPTPPPSSIQPATSPSGSVSYPTLGASYQGTISDKFTTPPTNTMMSLSQIQQDGPTIHGSFFVGPGLVGNGPFTGAVTTAQKIQFTVPSVGGHLPLLFQGQIKSDGSMAGTYCSYEGNNQCNNAAGGYGDWQLSRPTTGS
ncbi:MAG TPA: serine/threonine-protein kinase [Ktedonosporobacter sp.]|nr:serine/threonine-protein kinase [Ktedonosporobacter sp.]